MPHSFVCAKFVVNRIEFGVIAKNFAPAAQLRMTQALVTVMEGGKGMHLPSAAPLLLSRLCLLAFCHFSILPPSSDGPVRFALDSQRGALLSECGRHDGRHNRPQVDPGARPVLQRPVDACLECKARARRLDARPRRHSPG